MTYLSLNVNAYKSKEDVESVYKSLSNKHKNTHWAKNIERFLSNRKFENMSLRTANKNINEQIVQDTSKFNLVIFSASWCKPCIGEIPLLKQLHNDLNEKLNFIYISIDDEKGITPFINLNRENGINWRTLFAYPNVKKFKQKYFVDAIPHNILIYPNGDIEKIEVRIDEERAKLYSIFNSSTN
jgi:thiol-disulfide isomerase/thioredoxin